MPLPAGPPPGRGVHGGGRAWSSAPRSEGTVPRDAAIEASHRRPGRCGPAGLRRRVFATGAHLAELRRPRSRASTRRSSPPRWSAAARAGCWPTDARSRRAPESAVWAAALGGGQAIAFHATREPARGRRRGVGACPSSRGGRRLLLCPTPTPSRPTPAARAVGARPRRPHAGRAGQRRARSTATGRCSWVRRLVDSGAVGVRLEGVDMLPCVSQGAAPIGPRWL